MMEERDNGIMGWAIPHGGECCLGSRDWKDWELACWILPLRTKNLSGLFVCDVGQLRKEGGVTLVTSGNSTWLQNMESENKINFWMHRLLKKQGSSWFITEMTFKAIFFHPVQIQPRSPWNCWLCCINWELQIPRKCRVHPSIVDETFTLCC